MYQRVLEDQLEFPDGMMLEATDLLRGVSINKVQVLSLV
jgi:hypothetical protein